MPISKNEVMDAPEIVTAQEMPAGPLAEIEAIAKEAEREARAREKEAEIIALVPDDDPDISITIATAAAKTATYWENIGIFFADFERRFIKPKRSVVSVATYQAKSAREKGEIKGKSGAFIGGELKGGRRKLENLLNRTIWNGDIDECTPEFFAKLQAGGGIDFRGFVYSTFSHTPAAPRVRIVAPLSRPVSGDEYAEISPYICLKIEAANNCKLFDEHGNSAAQMMYNAYVPADGEYFFKDFRGPVLDVDALFAEKAEKEKEYAAQLAAAVHTTPAAVMPAKPAAKHKNTMPRDPRTRAGIPGIFNRAYYPIQDAINKFLPHIYEQTAPDRFTFKGGSTDNGLSIMDDLEAYSWHRTDPIGDGRAYDAFDIVAAHLYGGNIKDAKAALKNDARVKDKILDERRAEIEADFPDFPDDAESPGEWKERLKLTDAGDIAPTVSNCSLILENDPLFKNFAVNELADRVQVTGRLPWDRNPANVFWREADRAQLIEILDRLYADFSDRVFDTAFKAVTERRRFNPFRDWLNSLPAWDGVHRIAGLLPRAFDAETSLYTAAVMRKTLCAAIARVFRPGCEFNYVMILDGPQGIGKSSFFRWLAGSEYFTDSLTLEDMRSKTGGEKIQGYLFAEIRELAGMRKADIEAVRGFITSLFDDYRAAYGRVTERRPRVCILVGTVNGDRGYLRDTEGNRRFWPIKCRRSEGAGRIWNSLYSERDRVQIWAEAMAAYKAGEVLDMNTESLKEAVLMAQIGAVETDEREGKIERYLNLKYPDDWNSKSIEDRRAWLNSETLQKQVYGGQFKTKVCAMEIYREALEGDLKTMSKKDSDMIRRVMSKRTDWETTGEARPSFGIYGQNHGWTRTGMFDLNPHDEDEPDDPND